MSNGDKSAFPCFENHEKFNDLTGHYDDNFIPVGGLTKREYFAAVALRGLAARFPTASDPDAAKWSVIQADQLIVELEKTNNEK